MSSSQPHLLRLLMNAFNLRQNSRKAASYILWLLAASLLQAALAILTPSALAQSLPSFSKLTSSAVVAEIGTGVSCAWADYDNDGWPDLLIVNFDQPNLLYHNNRDGTFTRITTGHLVNTSADTTGATFGDYDGDGYLDLFVTVEDGPSFLYHNDGGTNFTLVTNANVGTLIAPSGGNAAGAAWADYNHDGFLDLFVIRPNAGGTNTLYRNNGNGTFTAVTPGAGAPEAIIDFNNEVGFCSWVDVDNDGWPDLFIGGRNECALYRNLGGTNFLKMPSSVFDRPAGRPVVGGSWADYDGDGLIDLVMGWDGGANSLTLYRNLGGGNFARVTAGDLGNGDTFNSTFPVWADANNDGFVDLFVGDAGGVNKFYRNNGDGTFTRFTSSLAINESNRAAAAVWADFNRDGWLDLFVNANNTNFTKSLYQNNGGTNAWLSVQCTRLSANTAAAIGARVRVQARIGGVLRWQTQQILGGDGRRSPHPLVAHFGLGDATSVETLVIEWPGGAGGSVTQTWSGLDVRQHLAFSQSAVSPPIIFAQPVSVVAASLPTNVVFTVSASGTPPLFYQWHSNGIPIAGANLPSLPLSFSVPAPTQNYTVVITNVNGASTSSIAQVTFPGLDSDRDGLPDIWEVQFGRNPSNPADALSFAVVGGVTNKLTYLQIYQTGLDPTKLDYDNDGLTDYDEIFLHGTDPKNQDTDGDGMPDGWEVQYGLNPRLNDANESKSFDGVTNLQKHQWNQAHPNIWEQMYPNRAFSGTNTVSDYERYTGIRTSRPVYDRNDRLIGVEYSSGVSLAYVYDGNGNLIRQKWLSRANEANGLPALFTFLNSLTNNTAANGPYGDADGDGWSNVQEFQVGTNPNDATSKPDTASNAGTNIASLQLPFTPTNFVMGVGQLDGLGAEEIVIGADGNPGTNTNFLLVLSQTYNGWATQRVDIGAFAVTSIAVGRPVGRAKGAIYCGVRASTGAASLVELSLIGTTWQSATVAVSTNGDAFVLGVMKDNELVARYSPSNGPSSAVYALTPVTNSTLWTGFPLLTNAASFDSGLLQEPLRGSAEWLIASRSGTSNVSITTVSPVVAASFQDNFDRPDGPVGNGWQFLAGQAADNYGIKANKLSGVGGLMFRPALLTSVVSLSGEMTDTVGNLGPSRYDATFAIRSDGTYASGYGIGIGRSDAGYANSGVSLFDGGQSIASQPSSFQFSGTLPVTVSFFANGSVTGAVGSFSFSFPPRAIDSVGQFFRYTQASSASKPQTLDNFAMSYTHRPTEQYVVQQSFGATNLHRPGRALAALGARNSATTNGAASLFHAVIADVNQSGAPDAGDEFSVTEYAIPPSTNLAGTTTRISLSGTGPSSHFGIAAVELIPLAPPLLFTAEPDGQVFSWQPPMATGALQRKRFTSSHQGKAWHALAALKLAEPGEGLVGLRVDPTNPSACSVFFWPPQQTMEPPLSIPQTAPSAVIYPPTNTRGSLAPVPVRLWDNEGNASLPSLQFQTPGSTIWSNATVLSVDGQTVGRVAALPTGSDHVLLWNAGRDLGAGFTNTVLLRVRASDVTLTGDYSVTAPYRVETPAQLLPVVDLVNPTAQASFLRGDIINLGAIATGIGGPIVRVTFFNGTTSLGDVTNGVYQLSWTNAPVGTSLLFASATDSLGATNLSAGVTVTVRVPTATTNVIVTANGQVQLSLRGGDHSRIYRVESSTNLVNWAELSTVTNTNGAAEFREQFPVNLRQKFYRVILVQ